MDGDFLAGADVDELLVVVIFEQEQAGFGEVIGVEKFAERRAGAPAGDDGSAGDFGVVELVDEGREDVGGLEVVVVVGAVHVGGHGGNEIAAVLLVEGFAKFDAGDFGDGVPLVGGFERAGEEVFLLERLGGEFGVDAGAAEEEELFDAAFKSAVDEMVLEGKIFVEEVNGLGAVGEDAADSGRGDDDIFRLFAAVEFTDGGGIEQIQFGAGFADQAR